LLSLFNQKPVILNKNVSIMPFLVPHRADHEFSETVGFIIQGPNKKVLFLPDVDSWKGINPPIEKLINLVNIAILDGTFFDDQELPFRNIKDVPHPFIKKSIRRFRKLDISEKQKIRFIHMNHTNPVLNNSGKEKRIINDLGLDIAKQGQIINI
jgi:pyrroloquinoline quinone biosynthesis protein B